MIRLATFNVENLFDRPAALNLKDSDRTNEILDQIGELGKLIEKLAYSPADKARILELDIALSRYIEIQEDVGKLFTGLGPRRRVGATGRKDWYGGIQFRRANFSDRQRINTATMLKKINADIQCLVEVEGIQALQSFNSELLNRRFKQFLSIDSVNDPRGIDLGLYLRKASLGRIRTNMFDREGSSSIWSRDCLEVECILPSGQSLHLLLNHFRSKFRGDTPEAQSRRARQARTVLKILENRYNLATDLYAVVGDLNDTPESGPIQPMMQSPLLRDVFDVAGQNADDRWTYYFSGQLNQIDYIFVSPKLAEKVRGVDVLRRGMTAVAEGRIAGLTAYEEFDSFSSAASDHAAIAVDLDI